MTENKKDIVIAHVRAIHNGYINFFDNHSEKDLYILSQPVLESIPDFYPERDMASITPDQAVKLVQSLDIFENVEKADDKTLKSLAEKGLKILMPDEDISKWIASEYFEDDLVSFDSVFLRWDRDKAIMEKDPEVDKVISYEDAVGELMNKAYKEAEKSSDWWRQIGALASKDNKVLLLAHNSHVPGDHGPYIFGDPRSNFDAGEFIELSTAGHAEGQLIAEAANKGIALKGADLYVTTFPCPNCAVYVSNSGINRLFFSEGYSKVDSADTLRRAKIEIIKVKK